MKNLFLTALLTVTVSFAGSAQKKNTFKVDAAASSVEWYASKVTGKHNGIVAVKNGTLVSDGKLVKGGTITMDMSTIKTTDLQGEWAAKLDGHLKADDFFGVEKNPTATITITKFNAKTLTGNLTIKGQTQEITFPYTVAANGKTLNATANVTLDRTKFGIKFGSKSIFADLGDKAINDDFDLKIKLVASK
jgi:polyisoprenoid-binding protein YceI